MWIFFGPVILSADIFGVAFHCGLCFSFLFPLVSAIVFVSLSLVLLLAVAFVSVFAVLLNSHVRVLFLCVLLRCFGFWVPVFVLAVVAWFCVRF